MRALLFPGQGTQYVGMGQEEYRAHPSVKRLFDRANEIVGRDLTRIMFDGPEEELNQTLNTQPAIFLYGFALCQLRDHQAGMAAGHSLGESTALTAARAMSFEDGLRWVKVRAEAMQEATALFTGSMAAIIGLDKEAVASICATVRQTHGYVTPANINSPGEIVVSGYAEPVAEVVRLAKAAEARLAKVLKVSGAFHSDLMASAYRRLSEVLSVTQISACDFPVISCITGKAMSAPEEIREALLSQLMQPVVWTDTIRQMISQGADEFVEVGPGNVLQKLLKQIQPEAKVTKLADLPFVESS